MWIYYSDDTFVQYAEGPDGYEPFSTGTYSFKEDGDFVLEEDGDNGTIVINRNKKKTSLRSGLSDYNSTHEYELGTLGFEQLFGPGDEGKEVEVILGDDNQLIYTDEDGVLSHLDSVWIMFTDKSFKQFVFMDDDVKLYGSGTYEFDDTGDFKYTGIEGESGKITLTYDYNVQLDGEGKENVKSITYDIRSLGLTCFYEKKPDTEPVHQ